VAVRLVEPSEQPPCVSGERMSAAVPDRTAVGVGVIPTVADLD